MGFFSKIKKLWKRDKTEPSKEVKEPKETKEPKPKELVKGKKDWKEALLISLQDAEPRLSVWLDIILDGIEKVGEELWQRIYFLFEALEVPKEEAEDFIKKFKNWLDEMGYESLEEFRSELQYRLTLALDLEDEEDERSRLFLKLSKGLNKTKEHLSKKIDNLIKRSSHFDSSFWEELEEILITADVGFNTTIEIVEKLKERVKEDNIKDPNEFKKLFQEEVIKLFPKPPKKIKPYPPEVVLMLGVNGVGKTTTIAKLAYRSILKGQKVLLAAGDTFRAAGIEQLKVWADRVGADFYAKEPKSDPAAVAYEALQLAKKNKYDVLFIDTAGRLHTKINLMEELKKIKRVLNKNHPGAPHRTILVLDATTGQNAISQTKLFNEHIGIDEIILTKLDGTAKGGIVLGICLEYKIPISFVGLGEKMEDLSPFDPERFTKALLE